MMKKLLLLAATAATTLSLSAQTVLFDFEDTNTLTDDFSFDQDGTGVFQQTTGGLSNGGGLRAPSTTNDFAAVANGAVTFNTSSDFSITQSVFFQTTSSVGARDADEPVILGLTDQSSQAAVSNYSFFTNNYINVAIRTNTDAVFPTNQVDYAFVWVGSGANNDFAGGATGGQLAADTWYQLSVDYNYRNATNDWSIDREVFSVDSDGLNPSSIASNTFTLPNPFGQNQDISLYGYLAADSGDAGSIARYDNATLVSSVPEPSAFAFIAGALALGCVATRRR